MEIIATLGALVMIVAVVVAKVATNGIVERMKRGIANVDSEKSRILNELKVARSKKNVGVANQKKLEVKKTKIKGKISRLKQELQSKREKPNSASRSATQPAAS